MKEQNLPPLSFLLKKLNNYNMEAKEEANKLIAEFSLDILKTIGHTLSMDMVKEMAKNSAISLSKQIMRMQYSDKRHWQNVINEIELHGKDQ